MFVYQDKAFCSAYAADKCANHGCDRAFTAQESDNARQWWGKFDAFGEPPVQFVDFAPTCGELIAPDDGSK